MPQPNQETLESTIGTRIDSVMTKFDVFGYKFCLLLVISLSETQFEIETLRPADSHAPETSANSNSGP